MKKLTTPTLSTGFSENGKKAKSRFENILCARKRRSVFLLILLFAMMLSCEFLLSCGKKENTPIWEKEQRELTQDEAAQHLKEELIKAYENTYGQFSPLSENPAPAADEEYLRYAISNLSLSGEDERFYKFPVIFEFWVEKSTGDIYKYYNGLDKTLTLFDPQDEFALGFAG